MLGTVSFEQRGISQKLVSELYLMVSTLKSGTKVQPGKILIKIVPISTGSMRCFSELRSLTESVLPAGCCSKKGDPIRITIGNIPAGFYFGRNLSGSISVLDLGSQISVKKVTFRIVLLFQNLRILVIGIRKAVKLQITLPWTAGHEKMNFCFSVPSPSRSEMLTTTNATCAGSMLRQTYCL